MTRGQIWQKFLKLLRFMALFPSLLNPKNHSRCGLAGVWIVGETLKGARAKGGWHHPSVVKEAACLSAPKAKPTGRYLRMGACLFGQCQCLKRFRESRAAKRGGFKRGGFPIWTFPSFFVLFCPPWDFPDFFGIFPICSGMVRGFS